MKYPREYDGKLVFFAATDGIKMTGFLMGEKGHEAVVFVHGMGGNFAKDGIIEGAKNLIKEGFMFFSINTRGADVVKSFRNISGTRYYLFGTSFERFEDSARDIKGAINYLEKRGVEKVHLMGHSTGCQKILYYAWKRRDPRVKTLIFLSPSDDYPLWVEYLGEDFGRAVEIAQNMEDMGLGESIHYYLYRRTGAIWSASRFLSFADRDRVEASLFNYDSDLKILSKVKLPMIFFFGTRDDTFSRGLSFYEEKIRKSYRGKQLEIVKVPGADHSFHNHEDVVFEKITQFLKKLI